MDVVSRDWGACGLAYLTGLPGGATRILRAREGWCAITLSRTDDVDAVPAPIERQVARDGAWPAVELGADNAYVDRMVTERRLAPC